MAGQIRLADGSSWEITARDRQASFLTFHLTQAMQLQPVREPIVNNMSRMRLTVAVNGNEVAVLLSEDEKTVVCTLPPATHTETTFASQLLKVSLVISQYAQTRGGVLLHGALAEWNGNGIILAGRSGIGKTTASQRLTSPWHSLSDDLTLVVRDAEGTYWAHPWPTWSQFTPGGPGGSWNVPYAVPLKRIFFLTQASEDRAESIGSGQAVCRLVESWDQARLGMLRSGDKNSRKIRCLQGFENICTLAQTIPCYNLHLSLAGPFWQEIENTMPPHTNSL
jgi:SynChlorMet cassette protein ScmC